MSDIFNLAPEGQAWTDNLSENNAALPEDYDPSFFAGSAYALPRGVAEGAIGLGQTITGFGKQVVSDPKTMMEWAPTYGILKSMFPGADESLNNAYDKTQSALESARQSIKPDPSTQGTAAQVLNGLGQFVPAIGATIAAGPVAGAGVAFGSSFEPTRQDFLKKGVDGDTATTLAAEQASFDALGMALPAAAGGGLATRLFSGIGINTSFGGLNRFAVSDTLEENGYSDMAKQYQVWDKQAIAVDAVLGATFGGLHHWNETRGAAADSQIDPQPQSAPNSTAAANDGTTVQPESPPAFSGDAAPVPDTAPVDTSAATESPATPLAPTYESRMAELQALAGNLIPAGERKSLAAQVHDLQYQHDQAAQQLQIVKDTPLAGSGKALSTARQQRAQTLANLDANISNLRQQIQDSSTTLADNSRGGRFFEAKADLSRIEQGIIPESMRELVEQSPVKPSDVDAAHVMNEGMHYDLESSPVVHASNESLNAHVAAMDEAMRNMMRGEPVNVSQQIQGLDGVIHPESVNAGFSQREGMASVMRDEGLSPDAMSPVLPVPTAGLREGSAFTGGREDAGEVSRDPDTGDVLSSNGYDLMAARDLAADPETKILHPDTGREVTLSQALADLDEQIATAKSESKAFSVAAACFLRNPS
jgi:hypothetical protein